MYTKFDHDVSQLVFFVSKYADDFIFFLCGLNRPYISLMVHSRIGMICSHKCCRGRRGGLLFFSSLSIWTRDSSVVSSKILFFSLIFFWPVQRRIDSNITVFPSTSSGLSSTNSSFSFFLYPLPPNHASRIQIMYLEAMQLRYCACLDDEISEDHIFINRRQEK